MNRLKEKWDHYGYERIFNYSKISEKINGDYPVVRFESNDAIVIRGDFPKYIYFILNGLAMGTRDYENGNEYDYFRLDESNGSVGLLEVLAQKEEIIATVICVSEVEAVRVPSEIVYEWIMQDLELLRLSARLLADDLYYRSGNDGLFYHLEGVDRLRYFMMTYYEEQKVDNISVVEVKESREKIANKLGTSLRTVGRSLKTLRDNQELISENRKIYIGPTEQQRLKQKLSSI